jgi:hypothetical protein
MPLMHMLPGKNVDAPTVAPQSASISPHLHRLLEIRLSEVCVGVLQWLEQAAASTLGPNQRPLRSPLDLGPPEVSPLGRPRTGKKVHQGRTRKVGVGQGSTLFVWAGLKCFADAATW